MVEYLHSIDGIKFENLFVDGTKIEANANRYTFVWKKAVNKNEARMYEKITTCIEELNNTFFADFSASKETLISDIDNVLEYLKIKCQEERIEFVQGIGKRKTQLQKFAEQLHEFKERQEKYKYT